jgi:hypothetical protein
MRKNFMPDRKLIYTAAGLCFGLVDWYFLALLASLSQNQALNDTLEQAPGVIRVLVVLALILANYGIWLVPVIPVAIYEMTRSQSLRRAAIAAAIVWSTAIISYYAYYTFLLMFAGLPNMEFMLFSNRQSAAYWTDWWPPFRRVIVDQVVEWIGIAVLGGAVVGWLSAYVYKRVSMRQVQRE